MSQDSDAGGPRQDRNSDDTISITEIYDYRIKRRYNRGVSYSDQRTPSFGGSHVATLLLRELLDVTDDFERALGDELAVNATDLTAMEHLIVAGALSPTALADRLHLSSAAVTSVVDRLAALGHVRRTPNPDDRRAPWWFPSPHRWAERWAASFPW